MEVRAPLSSRRAASTGRVAKYKKARFVRNAPFFFSRQARVPMSRLRILGGRISRPVYSVRHTVNEPAFRHDNFFISLASN